MTGESFDLIVTPQSGSLISNVADLKEWVDKAAAPYLGQLITEDQAKFAKKDLAELRKLKSALEDERKRAKAIIMKPYADFEVLYKQALSSLDEAISGIDAQLKEIDARLRAEKEAELRAFIREAAQDVGGDSLAEILGRDDVMQWFMDPKWLLASSTRSSAEKAIREKLVQVSREEFTIEKTAEEYYAPCMDVYYQTGSLALAIQKHSDLIAISRSRAMANKPEGTAREQDLLQEAQADIHKTEMISVEVPAEPDDPAELEIIKMPVVLAFPRYKKQMVREIMTKAGIKMLRPENR